MKGLACILGLAAVLSGTLAASTVHEKPTKQIIAAGSKKTGCDPGETTCKGPRPRR